MGGVLQAGALATCAGYLVMHALSPLETLPHPCLPYNLGEANLPD